MYAKETDLVAAALAGAFGDATPRVAKVLVLAMNAGAGDALAGLLVNKFPRDRLQTFLAAHFPLFAGKQHWSALGTLMHLLSHRTGNHVVDRVLEALDTASRCGDGNVVRWLAEVDRKRGCA